MVPVDYRWRWRLQLFARNIHDFVIVMSAKLPERCCNITVPFQINIETLDVSGVWQPVRVRQGWSFERPRSGED